MSGRRFLFIRDDGRTAGDVFPQIEDFLRNVRARNTAETWADPINYRTPFRTHRFHWKLVRDLDARGTPRLFVIPKEAERYSAGNELAALDVEGMLNAVDANFAGAAFFVTYPMTAGLSNDEILNKATLAVKDAEGELVSVRTGEKLYSGKSNEACLILFAVFKMGSLPIYSLYLNNDFLVNKVWFRDRDEDSLVSVFAENLGADSIFAPMVSGGARAIGPHLIYANGDFEIDFFGARFWEGVLEKQQAGSELTLDGHEPPSLESCLTIQTDVPYELKGAKLFVRPRAAVGFLKVEVKAGPFFQDFGFEQKWEWLVQRAYS